MTRSEGRGPPCAGPGRAGRAGHSPAMRTLARNDVCLMPAACLTSCLVPREKVEESVARLVLSKLSQCFRCRWFFFLFPFFSHITRATKDWLLGLCVMTVRSLKSTLILQFSLVFLFHFSCHGSYVRRLLAATLLVPRETGTVSSPHVSPSPLLPPSRPILSQFLSRLRRRRVSRGRRQFTCGRGSHGRRGVQAHTRAFALRLTRAERARTHPCVHSA